MIKEIFWKYYLLLLFFLIFNVSACSDLDYDAQKVDLIREGQFISGYNSETNQKQTVNGLRYETDTQSGITESGGKYKYMDKEYITFYLGNVKLGDKVRVEKYMSPVNLVPNANSIKDERVTNITRLLCSVGTKTGNTLNIPGSVIHVIENETKVKTDEEDDYVYEINFEDKAGDEEKTFSEYAVRIIQSLNEDTGNDTYSMIDAESAQESLLQGLAVAEQESQDDEDDQNNVDTGPDSYTITTHLIHYPLTTYFDKPEKVFVNGEQVMSDFYGGIRVDRTLTTNQANTFTITATRYNRVIGEKHYLIKHEPIEYTPAHQILYSYSIESKDAETIVIDLEATKDNGMNGVIVGYIPNVNIVGCSNDNQFLIDDTGQVYLSSTHQAVGAPLPFSSTENNRFYPLFSPDDHYCYAGNVKIDFEVWKAIYVYHEIVDGKWLDTDFPVYVDSRYATITDDERYLFQTSTPIKEAEQYTIASKVDLISNDIVDTIYIPEAEMFARNSLADLIVSPDGTRGYLTTFSSNYASLDIIDLVNKTVIDGIVGLSDYPGNSIFIDNYSKILFGSAGNSWYGGGNVNIISTDGALITQLNQFNVSILQYGHADCGQYAKSCGQYGAYAVARDRLGFLYVTSRYIRELGSKKEINNCSPGRRGIDQLEILSDGHFKYLQTFFLNAVDQKTMHFIKGK